MADYLIQIPLQIPPPGLDEVLAEPPGVLFFGERRQYDPRKTPRECGMEHHKLGEAAMHGDARRGFSSHGGSR